MKSSTFFQKKKFLTINKLFPNLKFPKKDKITDIKTLKNSNKNDLTFFDSIKYKALHQIQSHCIVLLQRD